MRQASLGVVTFLALALAGCGYFKQAPAPAAGPPTQELSAYGVTYELPRAGDPEDALAAARTQLRSLTANGIKWTNGTHTLEVVDDAMTLDGLKYGTVRRSDRVLLTADGVLSVNGRQRRQLTDD
jgi:hypothetical protein